MTDPQARINLALSMCQRTSVDPERRLLLIEAALQGAALWELAMMERRAS